MEEKEKIQQTNQTEQVENEDLQNKKLASRLIPWKTADYVRTISWFAIHTLLFVLGYVLVLFVNAKFDSQAVLDFIRQDGKVEDIVYLIVATCLISLTIFVYFYNENRDFLYETKNINLIFIVLEICIAISFGVGKFMVYFRPFALCALLSLLLMDKRTAIFMNAISCFLTFMIDVFLSDVLGSRTLYATLLIGFLTSVLAVYLVHKTSSRIKVFLMGFVIAIPIIISVLCFEFSTMIQNPIIFILAGFTSGMLSVVLMMAILPILERLFNKVTDYRLFEITDHKAPLLRKLRREAPGTFNHCLIVSTLVESCAGAIGENALLARACAYYHDVGKLKRPEFFTENQSGYNPHNEIPPELSTDIIRSHATDGEEIIKEYRLPSILGEVAVQHHGTMPITYFYMKASKFSESTLDIDKYSYVGPKPQSKIAAIVMIADACEAKARADGKHSHQAVDKIVCEIIQDRIARNQLDECNLTFKEIEIIRQTIVNALSGVHHDRVQYPKLVVGGDKYEGQISKKEN